LEALYKQLLNTFLHQSLQIDFIEVENLIHLLPQYPDQVPNKKAGLPMMWSSRCHTRRLGYLSAAKYFKRGSTGNIKTRSFPSSSHDGFGFL